MSHDSYDSDDNSESTSSEESGNYVCGFLDDPEWVSGRHRHVMYGDKSVGPIVSSTIQFVKPSELKRELNNKFRERFDGWEPPKSQRK
jgi:predicted RNase H-like nuclease